VTFCPLSVALRSTQPAGAYM